MRFQGEGWPRAMWIHRPFSTFTTVLTIQNEERPLAEKNWAPFFFSDSQPLENVESARYLHFVYSLRPLRVLCCNLSNGFCEWVFKQEFPDGFILYEARHVDGAMRGGTNFVSLPTITPGLRLYAGFPRTHIHGICSDNAIYRPELVILAIVDEINYHIAYASEPIDFGFAVLDEEARKDTCTEGRILIANSISRWYRQRGCDIMTLSLSVADRTVQIVRLAGVMDLLDTLPYIGALQSNSTDMESAFSNVPWSIAGHDTILCSIEAAANMQV
ncbi:hypothetical protein BDV59DRAFT_198918 [Aspergillus ambiguus]|uniref:uncharacterized protein n=1 Tax=Aspergillus ambiguus TaxID=176160 RepID=UPI003CCD76B3